MADQSVFDRYIKASFRAKSDADLTEVGLIRRATPLADAFQGRLPFMRELADINEHFGVEVAQTTFNLALSRLPAYGEFIKRVRSYDLQDWSPVAVGAKQYEVTFVASTLPVKGAEGFSQFERWQTWARSMGFTTDIILTDPDGSLRDNAQRISTYLVSNPHPRRILITHGPGATEFRTLLSTRFGLRGENNQAAWGQDLGELVSVRIWINIAGAYNGSSYAKLQNSSQLQQLLLRISNYWGFKGAAARARIWTQLDSRLPVWRVPPVFPLGLQVFNIIGSPLRTNMPVGLMASHDELGRQIGPNDGAVGVFESIAHPGLILPVQGMSHRAEDLKLEPVLKRLLALVVTEDAATEAPVYETGDQQISL